MHFWRESPAGNGRVNTYVLPGGKKSRLTLAFNNMTYYMYMHFNRFWKSLANLFSVIIIKILSNNVHVNVTTHLLVALFCCLLDFHFLKINKLTQVYLSSFIFHMGRKQAFSIAKNLHVCENQVLTVALK